MRRQPLSWTAMTAMKNRCCTEVEFLSKFELEMNSVRRNKEPEKVLNVSYRDLLKPFTDYNTENIYLDNAYIQQSSKASILFFDGWTSSVIPYIKETQLKRELNEIFQNTYPAIPASFTYILHFTL